MQCPSSYPSAFLHFEAVQSCSVKQVLLSPAPMAKYSCVQCSEELKAWQDQVKMECDMLWASICDPCAKANFRNQENWRRKIAEADGLLDKQVF